MTTKERITCRTHCPCWNSIDKDCELFGENHPTPKKCPHFINENKGFDLSKIKVANLFEMEDDFMEIEDDSK